jgi:hypothetical protein
VVRHWTAALASFHRCTFTPLTSNHTATASPPGTINRSRLPGCVRRREEQQEVPHDKRETTECRRNAEKLGNRVLVAKPRPRPSIVRRIVQVAVEEDAWPTTNSKKSIVRQHDNGFQSFRCIRDFLVFAISSASFFSSGNASLYSLDSTLLRRFPNA